MLLYPPLAFLFATAVFLAVIVTLALRQSTANKIITVSVIVSAVIALGFYGFGYGMSATTPTESFIAGCRAMFSTTFMFVGRENYSELVRTAPWFAENGWLQILFWVVHMAAMYATASTILSTIGARLLRQLRTLTLPLGRVCMLYGDNEASLAAARTLSEQGYRPLIISESDPIDIVGRADVAGRVVWNEERVREDGRWLSRLGIRSGRHTLELICFNKDDRQLKDFLMRVIDALKAQRIMAAQVHVSVICQSEANFDFLSRIQIEPGKHLAADIYTKPYLAAMRLMREAGPYQTMRFDQMGTADGDFSAMIVGFGGVGQNVLRLLVRNGQFNGSRFSATVVDRDLNACTGAFTSLYADLIRRYQITFAEMDARSEAFVKLLDGISPRLRYIVVCTGSEAIDRQIANQICTYRMCHASRFLPDMVIAMCDLEQVTLCGGKARRDVIREGQRESGRENDVTVPVVQVGDLLEGEPDRIARAVNAIYWKPTALNRYPDDPDARAAFYRNNWYSIDNISRMSSRAMAAAVPAMLAAAGVKEGDAAGLARCRERLGSDPAFRLSLSQMEHLRWNAFESSIGILQMPAEEFQRRIAEAEAAAEQALEVLAPLKDRLGGAEADAEGLKQEAEKAYGDFRTVFGRVRKQIPTFGVGGLHVCLTGWEELDALWAQYAPLDALARRIEGLRTQILCLAPGMPGVPELPAAQDFQQLDTNNVEGILAWLSEEWAG